MAGQVGEEGADLVREHELWILEVLQQPWKNIGSIHQHLETERGVRETGEIVTADLIVIERVSVCVCHKLRCTT